MEELKKECRRTIIFLGLYPIAGLVALRLIQYMNIFQPRILHTVYLCVLAPCYYAYIGNRYGFFDTLKDGVLSFVTPVIPSGIMFMSYSVIVFLFSEINQALIVRTLGLIIFHYIIYAVLFIIFKSFMWDVNVDEKIYKYDFPEQIEEEILYEEEPEE